jgi:hypothetical protein
MAVDYYAEADKIINALAAEGLTAEANSLRDAIAAGWVRNATTKRIIRDLMAELDQLLS